MDLIGNIQYDSVECLNQREEDENDMAHSLLRQLQEDTEQPIQIGFGVIQSHEDDPQLLIKIPFIEPAKIQTVTLTVNNTESAPSTIKLYIDLPNMDFSDLDKPPLQQFLVSASDYSPENTIILSVSPVKARQCTSVALFLENDSSTSVAISSLTISGIIIAGSGGPLKKVKGWQPFTRGKSITAFIRNNTDHKNKKTVMERKRVDMHDLQVAEAITVLDYLTRRYRETHLPYLDVITGKGKHSPEGKPNIKPAVEQWLITNKFQRLAMTSDEFKNGANYKNAFSEHPTNTGVIRIFF